MNASMLLTRDASRTHNRVFDRDGKISLRGYKVAAHRKDRRVARAELLRDGVEYIAFTAARCTGRHTS